MAERLLAIQAQDPRGFRLAVRARASGLVAADVDGALSKDRSLVVSTLNRGTLHLVRVEDYWWLRVLTTPALRAAGDRRLAQTGVTPAMAERSVGVVVRSLGADGPLGRDALRSRLAAAGLPTAGQALAHVLFKASIDGLVVRGPVFGGDHRFALVDDWLGPAPGVDRDVALAELARRYLTGHGPASEWDLAGWAGIGIIEARRGLQAISDLLVGGLDGLVDLARADRVIRRPPPLLLGPFDPLLLGWRDRSAILAGNRTVVTANGIFRPVLLVDGHAAATWRLASGVVRLTPFRRLTAAVLGAAQREALAVGHFLGLGPLPVHVTEVSAPGQGSP